MSRTEMMTIISNPIKCNNLATWCSWLTYQSVTLKIRGFKSRRGCIMEDKDTKKKGNITELEVMNYVTKLGYQVSIPFGDRARYDQNWDVEGKLLKIQVKSSALSKDGTYLEISCKSTNRVNGKIVSKTYTPEEIDYIASFHNGKCYVIPITEIAGKSKILRIEPPKNGQIININWAKEYEVENML